MRKEKKEANKKDASDGLKRTFTPPDLNSDDLDKLTEIYGTPFSMPSDNEMTEREAEQTKKVYDEEGYDGTGYDRWGFNKDGFNEDGFNELGFNKDGFNKDNKRFNEYNRHSYNHDGFNRWGYNINGYNRSCYDDQNYNINGYNRHSFDRKVNKRRGLKKKTPGSGLKILTSQQMFTRLPILLA